MRGSFWNIDGFRDATKHSFVHETIREHKLDFFAIIETGRSSFLLPFLNHLSVGSNYVWYFLLPIGRSGGMLVGLNSSIFSVKDFKIGDRCIKFHVPNKSDGFEWFMVAMYGVAQEAHMLIFLLNLCVFA
jgi:hypothetical protein